MTERMTARELIAQLEADTEFVARRAQAEARSEEQEAELRRAEAPLIRDLRGVGIGVASVWDLIGSDLRSTAVMEVLVDHLSKPYPAGVRESIARALALPAARPYWDLLSRAYRDEREDGPKDGLAVALSSVVDETTFDEFVELARDKKLGPSRVLLIQALPRFGEKGRQALAAMRDDPDLRESVTDLSRRAGRTRRVDREPASHPGPTDLEEAASLSLELSSVGVFLDALVGLNIGFKRSDAEELMARIGELSLDETAELNVVLDHDGPGIPLHIEAFADDFDAFDIYLFAPTSIKTALENLATEFTRTR